MLVRKICEAISSQKVVGIRHEKTLHLSAFWVEYEALVLFEDDVFSADLGTYQSHKSKTMTKDKENYNTNTIYERKIQ